MESAQGDWQGDGGRFGFCGAESCEVAPLSSLSCPIACAYLYTADASPVVQLYFTVRAVSYHVPAAYGHIFGDESEDVTCQALL